MELALDILPQVLVDGIVLGFMYALIALGYTMVYGVLEFINFAHSEIFVLGAFVGVEILLLLESAGYLATLHTAFVLLVVILSGMLVSGLAAVALERVAYRPLQRSPRLVALISAIGASFFLQDALRFFESLWRNTFYLTYPTLDVLDKTVPLGLNVVVPVKSLLVIVTALVALAVLHLFVNRTRLGAAIRAVAQDPDTASLIGIPVNRVIALTFLWAGRWVVWPACSLVCITAWSTPTADFSRGSRPLPLPCWAASEIFPAPCWAEWFWACWRRLRLPISRFSLTEHSERSTKMSLLSLSSF